jgi:3'-phosphoadenosine 5'-phosphosulfate sulfotransferase (PAPS reductase)/FAD synthetase
MIIVSVSGGKDSVACLLLALKQYDKKDIVPLFADTNFEHSLTYKYLDYLENKLKVKIEKVKSKKYKGVIDCIRDKHMFPSGIRRFCTHNLKLIPIWDFIIENKLESSEQWLGIRADESVGRNKKYGNFTDEPMDFFWINPKVPKILRKMQVRLPIINWTEKDCFKHIRRFGIDCNPLYKMGHGRVGCYPCVISGLKDYKKCWMNPEGRKNIKALFKLEEEFNNQGLNSRIKPDADRFRLKKILEMEESKLNLFDDDEIGCAYCQI